MHTEVGCGRCMNGARNGFFFNELGVVHKTTFLFENTVADKFQYHSLVHHHLWDFVMIFNNYLWIHTQ